MFSFCSQIARIFLIQTKTSALQNRAERRFRILLSEFGFAGEKIGQGRENAKTYLRENPLVCEEVEAKVREKFQLDGTAEETDAEGEPEVLEDEE